MGPLKKYPPHVYVLPLLDWLTLTGSLAAAITLRGGLFSGSYRMTGAPIAGEIVFLFLYGAVATLIFAYLNLYKINVFITVADQTYRILKALLFTIVGIAILSFFTKAEFIVESRLAMIYFGLISFGMMLGGRVIIFRALFLFLSRHRVFNRNVLIVGAGENGKKLGINVFLNDHLGLNLAGYLDDDLPLGKIVFNRAKVLGRVGELGDIVKVFDVQEIVISLENIDHTQLINVLEIATATGAVVKISSPLYDVVPARLFIEKYGNVPVVGISQISPSPMLEVYKRVVDVAIVAVGLLFLLPFFALVALLIKLDSRGPVLFSQVRIGKNGKPFKFYKFRSMKIGSDQDQEREKTAVEFIRKKGHVTPSVKVSTKIVNESRVTMVGKLLRKTSLDELPQLINVLKGDMSLVGPRPCLPYEWEHYEEWHKRRLSVIPGCTGMWQVTGRSVVGFEDMVILDLYYIQNASVLLDFGLLLRTLPVMLFGTGAK